MTKTQQISEALTAAGYSVNEWTNPRGEVAVAARNGSKVADISEEADGTIHASMFIDYGTDGRSHCDSATMKTTGGIIRKVAQFLGKAA